MKVYFDGVGKIDMLVRVDDIRSLLYGTSQRILSRPYGHQDVTPTSCSSHK